LIGGEKLYEEITPKNWEEYKDVLRELLRMRKIDQDTFRQEMDRFRDFEEGYEYPPGWSLGPDGTPVFAP